MAMYYILLTFQHMINSTFYYCWEKKTRDETYVFTWSAQSVNSICALHPWCHRWAFARGRLHHDEASRPWKRFQNGGSLNGTTVFPPFAVYLRSFRTFLLVMLWVRIKNEQRPLIRYVSFLLRSVLKQRAWRIIQGFSCCHFFLIFYRSLSFF